MFMSRGNRVQLKLKQNFISNKEREREREREASYFTGFNDKDVENGSVGNSLL